MSNNSNKTENMSCNQVAHESTSTPAPSPMLESDKGNINKVSFFSLEESQNDYYDLKGYCDFKKIINENVEFDDIKKEFLKHDLKIINVNGLYLVKYLKEKLNTENITTLGLFRSVILNTSGDIICCSLAKSLDVEIFKASVKGGENKKETSCEGEEVEKYKTIEGRYVTSLMVDGTMINVFWNENTNDWELATKSNIGANCKFNTDKTFRYMFLDCMNEVGLEFEQLDKNYSYSFVFQHPENRIVQNIQEKKIYFIARFNIDENNRVFPEYSYNGNYQINKTQQLDFIHIERFTEEVVDTIQTLKLTEGYDSDGIPGIMIYDTLTGHRIKFRNERYEYIRRLKKNTNKEQFLYYSLRHEKQVKQFLNHFPEKVEAFQVMNKIVCDWTNQLYSMYINCFIKKEKHVKQYPYQFVPHMCKLHDIYLKELRPQNHKMHKQKVISYVNNLRPEQLMFVINYEKRPKRDIQKPTSQTACEIGGEINQQINEQTIQKTNDEEKIKTD
tara:strand:- start:6 stop:1511 length:1506 start_codon:yes stop_codon:yes gene_type:complete